MSETYIPQRNIIATGNLPQYQLYGAVYKGSRYVRTPEEKTYDPTNKNGVLQAIDTYLAAMPNESQSNFNLRKARASFQNYCQEIIRVYLATFFAAGNQVDRSLVVEALGEELAGNIDLRGTAIDSFLRRGEKEALNYGWALCLTDLTNPTAIAINSLADERAIVRPYSRWVVPSNIWDWKRDPITHELTFLVIDEGNHPWYEDKHVWSVWNSLEWQIVDSEGTLLNSGEHNLGFVPADILVCDEPSEDSDTEPFGHSALRDVADLQLELYRTSSELEDLLRKTAFPFLHIRVDPEDTARSSGAQPIGPDYGLKTSAEVAWVTPDTNAASVLAERVVYLSNEIRQIAGIATRSEESTEAHSGAALSWEYSTKHSLVKLRAEQLRHFESRLWRRYGKLLNIEIPWQSVKYPSEYATALGPTDKLDLKTLIEIKAPLEIIRKHFRAQVLREYAHLPDLSTLFEKIDSWVPGDAWPVPVSETDREGQGTQPGAGAGAEAMASSATEPDPTETTDKTLDSAGKILALVTTLTQNHAPQEAIRALVVRAFQQIGITDQSVITAITGCEFAWYTDTSQVDPTEALPAGVTDSVIP
jgi:hypothetical protein